MATLLSTRCATPNNLGRKSHQSNKLATFGGAWEGGTVNCVSLAGRSFIQLNPRSHALRVSEPLFRSADSGPQNGQACIHAPGVANKPRMGQESKIEFCRECIIGEPSIFLLRNCCRFQTQHHKHLPR